ncbi:MAG: sugar ABC transporter ATP-binding protein [Verrucomicrobia bacterium]|nr:sugar ABC transporter ATP-binding protein [Verrucomicrobiota bacterium]
MASNPERCVPARRSVLAKETPPRPGIGHGGTCPSFRPELPRIRTAGLGKSYAVPVLSGVDFECLPGEVHALIGANGAGKSTLAKILCGLVRADAGTMSLDGVPYAPAGKPDAEASGIHIVHQELNLIGTLTVAENLFLSRLPRRLGIVNRARLRRDAREALARVDLGDLDPDTPVARLGVGVRQQIEIAGALAQNCRLLILDEPTAALMDPQVERLFEHIRGLRAAGVSVIYVSHRMDEIRRIADRVSVLRDGRLVATRAAAGLAPDEAVRLMAGRDLESANPAPRTPGPARLRVEGLCRHGAVNNVSFEARAGEILGIAGLVGSGRTELLRAIFGADRADAGGVRIGDSPPRRFRSPREAVAVGLAMIPEDRKEHGLLMPRAIRVNATLAHLPAFRRRGGRIDRRAEALAVQAAGESMDLRSNGPEQPVAELSGGNQQKVLIGRWLMRDADIYLFDEPTRGIDVAAKATVYRLLDDLARRGKACVIVSSEMEELMAVCDRIAVLSQGRLVRTFARGAWSHERLLTAAFEGMTAAAAHRETQP